MAKQRPVLFRCLFHSAVSSPESACRCREDQPSSAFDGGGFAWVPFSDKAHDAAACSEGRLEADVLPGKSCQVVFAEVFTHLCFEAH